MRVYIMYMHACDCVHAYVHTCVYVDVCKSIKNPMLNNASGSCKFALCNRLAKEVKHTRVATCRPDGNNCFSVECTQLFQDAACSDDTR